MIMDMVPSAKALYRIYYPASVGIFGAGIYRWIRFGDSGAVVPCVCAVIMLALAITLHYLDRRGPAD